jgi:uncharacterized protein YndB with AHSA1/START domain
MADAGATTIKHLGTLRLFAQGTREIVMQREFDAARERVFDAFTQAGIVKQWMGPGSRSLIICTIDPVRGGAYRFLMRRPPGEEIGWSGVFRDVVRPERLVQTERFEPAWYPGEAVITTVFDECAGSTRVTITMTYESREARDIVLAAQIRDGEIENYDRLARLLA